MHGATGTGDRKMDDKGEENIRETRYATNAYDTPKPIHERGIGLSN